jgi:hypothetical protein
MMLRCDRFALVGSCLRCVLHAGMRPRREVEVGAMQACWLSCVRGRCWDSRFRFPCSAWVSTEPIIKRGSCWKLLLAECGSLGSWFATVLRERFTSAYMWGVLSKSWLPD